MLTSSISFNSLLQIDTDFMIDYLSRDILEDKITIPDCRHLEESKPNWNLWPAGHYNTKLELVLRQDRFWCSSSRIALTAANSIVILKHRQAAD